MARKRSIKKQLFRLRTAKRRRHTPLRMEVLEDRRLLFANNSSLSDLFAPVRAPVHEDITAEGLSFLTQAALARIQNANVSTDLGLLDRTFRTSRLQYLGIFGGLNCVIGRRQRWGRRGVGGCGDGGALVPS